MNSGMASWLVDTVDPVVEVRAAPAPRTARRWIPVLAAVAVALLGFVVRFNALGGSLGGLESEDYPTLTRVDMVLSGYQPLRDFADSELRGAWPSLSFEVPALAQRIFGRTLLVYASVTLGCLMLCAAIVVIFGWRLSGDWPIGLLAGGVVIASWTVPYNYPKVLAPTVGAILVWWMMRQPSTVRLGALAVWTVMAALFRHDYGVYVAVGALVGIVAAQPRPWTIPARRLSVFLGLTALAALPSAVWVAWHAGLTRYFRDVLVHVRTDMANNPPLGERPVIDFAAPFSVDSLIAFNYYMYWALPVAALAVLVTRLASRRGRGADPLTAYGVVLLTTTVVVNYFFVRSHLQARFGDGVVPMVLLGPWIVAAGADIRSTIGRVAARVGPTVGLAAMLAAFFPINEIPRELDTGGFDGGSSGVQRRFSANVRELANLPPTDWAGVHAHGVLALSRYLAECTATTDRVLVGHYADEVPHLARRLFAGGQAYFAFSFLKTEADQHLVLERLRSQSVPVFVAWFDYENEFVRNYPIVARYVAARYREVGVIDAYDQPYFRVFVEADRQPVRTDSALGFPCYR